MELIQVEAQIASHLTSLRTTHVEQDDTRTQRDLLMVERYKLIVEKIQLMYKMKVDPLLKTTVEDYKRSENFVDSAQAMMMSKIMRYLLAACS